jgi:two-component system chemotaxis response regulator CheB
MSQKTNKYQAIVIGTSAGGLDALAMILPEIRKDLPVPIIIVLHISASSESYLVDYLDKMTSIRVKEAEDKEELKPGTVYFAPPDYHILVEEDFTLSLSNSEKVNYSRPSIDVLFETASWAYKNELIGVLLTGANWDGADGLKTIHETGGFTIVQDPKSAHVPRMPESAIEKFKPSKILKLNKISGALNDLC